MEHTIKIGVKNVNGLANHTQELRVFINVNKLDIILISETHFTEETE